MKKKYKISPQTCSWSNFNIVLHIQFRDTIWFVAYHIHAETACSFQYFFIYFHCMYTDQHSASAVRSLQCIQCHVATLCSVSSLCSLHLTMLVHRQFTGVESHWRQWRILATSSGLGQSCESSVSLTGRGGETRGTLSAMAGSGGRRSTSTLQ